MSDSPYKLASMILKPWGYELIWARTDKYVGKILFIKAGHRLSLQKHEKKHETLYLQKGVADITIGDAVKRFDTEVSVEIPPGTIHRIAAVEDSTFLEVSTPELDDVIRLEDDYRRV